MVVLYKDYIEDKVIKNLLKTHERVCEQGSTDDVIKITKYITRLINKRNQKLLELGLEEHECYPQTPPNKSEQNIT